MYVYESMKTNQSRTMNLFNYSKIVHPRSEVEYNSNRISLAYNDTLVPANQKIRRTIGKNIYYKEK